MPIKGVCKECGAATVSSPSRPKLFCSVSCSMRYNRTGSRNPLWNGGSTQTNGYVRIIQPEHPRASEDGYVYAHVLIAEKAVGKYLPKTVEVHHFDEDKSNNSNANLVVCQDLSYHRLLHSRRRVQLAGGNPDTDVICGKCGVQPRANFTQSRGKSTGLAWLCRACSADQFQGHIKARRKELRNASQAAAAS